MVEALLKQIGETKQVVSKAVQEEKEKKVQIYSEALIEQINLDAWKFKKTLENINKKRIEITNQISEVTHRDKIDDAAISEIDNLISQWSETVTQSFAS